MNTRSTQWDVIVIGAGHNGLVCGAYLAKWGLRVIILERRHMVGGACATEEIFPGFKINTAGYVYSLFRPRIVEDLNLVRHGLEILPSDPVLFNPFPDGRYLFVWSDRKKTADEIKKFSRKDAETYIEFSELLDRLAKFFVPLMDMTPPSIEPCRAGDLWKFVCLAARFCKLKRDRYRALSLVTSSIKDILDQLYESSQVKGLFAGSASSGFSGGLTMAGTGYSFLHHAMGEVKGKRALWGSVRGGVGTLATAVAQSVREHGGIIRTQAEVRHVLVKNGQAVGVVLKNGEEVRGRVVVSNADPKRTFLGLVEPGHIDSYFIDQVKAIKMNGISTKVNCAMGELPEFIACRGRIMDLQQRAIIHISPSMEYLEQAWEDCRQGRPSRRPYLSCHIQSAVDPSVAPPGKHTLTIFAQYSPYTLKDEDWNRVRQDFGDRVIETLGEYAPNVRDAIIHREILSPLDLEERFYLTGGHPMHGEQSLDQLFMLRPIPGWAQYRTPIRNLYLCGAGTHPGGGYTGAPGRNAAREILKDWKK